MNSAEAYELALFALCLWREARGQSDPEKIAVACSIRNRVMHPSWYGSGWVGVILRPEQYSSFNTDDPNATKWPLPGDVAWASCLAIAAQVYAGEGADMSNGATHYFSGNVVPGWALNGKMVRTAAVGAFTFYKQVAGK